MLGGERNRNMGETEGIDINELFKQMDEIMAEQGSIPVSRQDELPGILPKVVEILKNGTGYFQSDRDHELRCPEEDCKIEPLVVFYYKDTKHTCVKLCNEIFCSEHNEDNKNVDQHKGPCVKDGKTYFFCTKTRFVHECGDGCRAGKYMTNDESQYVCPISWRVLGVEAIGEWWTEPDKQNNILTEEPEPDRDMMEAINPSYSTKIVYDEKGNSKIVKEHNYSEIKITTHLSYHTTPFEKEYGYYLKRAKSILCLLMYSPDRQKIEKKKLENSLSNLKKAIDKYVRSCKKANCLTDYFFILVLQRLYMRGRRGPVWIPPFRTMELLLKNYANLIVKFYWIILEKTPFGIRGHTHVAFDYFVLATAKIMKTRGLIINGTTVLKKEDILALQMPDPNTMGQFGISVSLITKTHNSICKAIEEVDPKTIQVTITPNDRKLYCQSRDRRLKELREEEKRESIEERIMEPNSPGISPGKKRKQSQVSPDTVKTTKKTRKVHV